MFGMALLVPAVVPAIAGRYGVRRIGIVGYSLLIFHMKTR